MTTALERVNTAYAVARTRPRTRPGKSFVEPPFWALDAMRTPFMSSLPDRERIEHDFEGYVRGAGKASGIVFACFYARLRHYVQAEFRWQNRVTGELSDPGQGDLSILDTPWPTGSSVDLLAWMEVDASFAGNSYWTYTDDEGRFGKRAAGPTRRLSRMRPDWVWIVIGSNSGDPYALDARIVAFVYEPRIGGGMAAGFGTTPDRQVILTPAEVVHYAPLPDGEARFRGMSWLTPVLREVAADRAAVNHKLRFFERGASLQTIVALDKDVSVDAFDAFVERFRASHEGSDNAFKTLFVGGGADVTVSSADLQQIDFKRVTGGGETRIAADAGVHPVLVPLSEGLAGSALNAGNYKAAARSFADGTLTHLWKCTTKSLQNLARPPKGWKLAWDPDVPFLRDDATDVATVQKTQAAALHTLVIAGYEPDAAVEYLLSNDLRKLRRRHTGLFSVQLQPAGSTTVPAPREGTQETSGLNGHGRIKELTGGGM